MSWRHNHSHWFESANGVNIVVHNSELTDLRLDKKAAISQTIFSDAFPIRNVCILIKISRKFAPKCTIDNEPTLV